MTQIKAHRQLGFTMVELMVALLIGLFLMGGLITLVQNNKRAFTSQNGLAGLQDAERLALIMLNDVVQQAGYFPDPTTNTALSSMLLYTLPGPAAPATGTLAAGQSIIGNAAASANAVGDTITVRYATAPLDGILNCSGNSNPNPAGGVNIPWTNTFFVSSPTAATPNTLICVLQDNVQYPLVNGVTNMTILYGVATGAAGNNVDTYMTAAQVTVAAAWNSVVSVQITLTFKNPLVGQPGQPTGGPASFQVQRTISIMNKV